MSAERRLTGMEKWLKDVQWYTLENASPQDFLAAVQTLEISPVYTKLTFKRETENDNPFKIKGYIEWDSLYGTGFQLASIRQNFNITKDIQDDEYDQELAKMISSPTDMDIIEVSIGKTKKRKEDGFEAFRKEVLPVFVERGYLPSECHVILSGRRKLGAFYRGADLYYPTIADAISLRVWPKIGKEDRAAIMQWWGKFQEQRAQTNAAQS